MTSQFSDELISAYLDGELTADEQSYVEKQLRDNADLRRMCDELRMLRVTLQAMPAEEPRGDLAERVLRGAERRMLSGPDGADKDPDPSPNTQPKALPTSGRSRDWRAAVGVIVTLAALVLIALWLPGQLTRDVAQAPSESVSAPTPEGDEPFLEQPEAGAEDEEAVDDGAGAAPDMSRTLGRDRHKYHVDQIEGEGIALPMSPSRPAPSGKAYGRGEMLKDEVPSAPSGDSAWKKAGTRSSVAESETRGGQPLDIGLARGRDGGAMAGAPGMGGGGGMGGGLGNPKGDLDNEKSEVAREARHRWGTTEKDGFGMQGNRRQDSGQSDRKSGMGDRAVAQQLIDQFDRDQVLLVQITVPIARQAEIERELSESLGFANVPTDVASRFVRGKKAAKDRTLALSVLAGERWYRAATIKGQNVVVVEGSAPEIRASLTNLAARSGVTVVPTSVDELAVLELKKQSRRVGTAGVDKLGMKNSADAPTSEAGAGAKKLDDADHAETNDSMRGIASNKKPASRTQEAKRAPGQNTAKLTEKVPAGDLQYGAAAGESAVTTQPQAGDAGGAGVEGKPGEHTPAKQKRAKAFAFYATPQPDNQSAVVHILFRLKTAAAGSAPAEAAKED